MPYEKPESMWKFSRREGDDKVPVQPNPIQPPHYDFPGGVRVIDLTQHLNFCKGNIVKYVCRAGRKPGCELEDLKKARWYLEQEIARLERARGG